MFRILESFRAVDHLKKENTFAAISFGDNYVSAALAHVDVMGSVYPYRLQHAFFKRDKRHDPDARELDAALRKCWEGLGNNPELEASQILVALPPWASRSRMAEARLVVPSEEGAGMYARKVDKIVVRSLQDVMCAKNTPAGYVVSDLIPQYYTTDTGSTLGNPISATTSTLAMRGHLVMTELSVARIILDCLKSKSVWATHLTTAFCATGFNIWPDEKQRGVALIEVDRLRTYCSFFENGVLVHTCQVDGGSIETLSDAAHRLDVPPGDLALWLNDREELMRYADPQIEIAWPSATRKPNGPRTLGDIENAARPMAEKIMGRIQAALKGVDEAVNRGIRNVVLMGDDPLIMRALRSAFREVGGAQCEWRVPPKVHGEQHRAVPGFARMIGLLRMPRLWKERRQPFLESYNESVVETVNGTFWRMFVNRDGFRAPKTGSLSVTTPGFADTIRRWLF